MNSPNSMAWKSASDGAQKLPLSQTALAAIAAANSWEQDRVAQSLASGRRGWMAAGIGGVLAVLGFAMGAFQSLRPPPAPYPVVVDRTTGETSVVATLDAANVPVLAALDQHNVAVFVRARESYNFGLLQRDYDQVGRMTVPETWAPYGVQFAGERAMQTVIAAKEEHRVTIVSVRLTRSSAAGKPGEAVATFDRQVRPAQGLIPTTTRYVSTVRYEYRPSAMKLPTDRIENPFGFVVTSYRADAELVSASQIGRSGCGCSAMNSVAEFLVKAVAWAAVLCGAPVLAQSSASQQRLPDPRLQTVSFAADRVLDVPVRRGQITQIVLGDDEQIVGVPLSGKGANCADETHTWCIARQGQDLFVKPKAGATTTNLIVVTDRRRHVFLLHPVEGTGPSLMRLTVTSPAPLLPPPTVLASPAITPASAEPPARSAPLPLTAQELIDERWRVLPVVRNTAYSLATGKDSEDIVPVMVFDDGTQTYFSFPNNRPLPTVFEVAPDGSEEMVNSRMDADGQLVADRVGRRFVLRLGQRVAAIINEAFDLDGVAPKDGTTVTGVVRVLKKPADELNSRLTPPKAALIAPAAASHRAQP